MTRVESAASKIKELRAKYSELQAQADALLLREDYDGESETEVEKVVKEMDAIRKRVAALEEHFDDHDGDEEADKADGDGENETLDADPEKCNSKRGWNRSPAYLRSRGRKSSDNIHMFAKEEKYCLVRAINDANKRGHLTGVEKEVDQELRRTQNCNGQFLMPMGDVNKLNTRADLTLTTGAGAIPVYWKDFIDYLYPIQVLPKVGAKFLQGLQGVTKIPRQSGIPTVAAVAEEGAASASAPTIDNMVLTPNTLTANVTISRKFAEQSVISADQFVMNALATQMGVQIDQWAITGSGQNNQPTGLLNNTGLTNVQVAAANTVAYTDIVAMEKQVANANALFGNLAWVTSPSGYAKLETTPKIGSTFPVFIISDNKEINGNPVVRSTQIPTNLTYSGASTYTALIYGAWQFLVVAFFGSGLSIISDPYTQSTSGSLVVTALLDADTNLEHPNAFCPLLNLAP